MSVHDLPCGCRVTDLPCGCRIHKDGNPDHTHTDPCEYHDGSACAVGPPPKRFVIEIDVLPVPEQGDLTEGKEP